MVNVYLVVNEWEAKYNFGIRKIFPNINLVFMTTSEVGSRKFPTAH